MIEQKKSNKLITLLVAIALIISITIIVFSLYKIEGYNKENAYKKEENGVEIKYLDDMIYLIKDYYFQNNLAPFVTNWEIKKVTYLGEFEYKIPTEKESKEYNWYKMEGTYTCENKIIGCMGISKSEEVSPGINQYYVYILTEKNNGKEEIKHTTPTVTSEVLNAEDNKKGRELSRNMDEANRLSVLFQRYYEDNNLVDKKNVKSWNIINVEYMKKENENYMYIIKGTYTCKDDTPNCVYVDQVDEKNASGGYDYVLYLLLNDKKDKILNIESLGAEQNIEDIFDPTPIKNILISDLKMFYANNNLVNEDNLEQWDIKQVVLVGTKLNIETADYEKIYKFIGSYKCKDESSDCVYLEQVEEQTTDGSYPFQLYLDYKATNDQTYSGYVDLTDYDIINIVVK